MKDIRRGNKRIYYISHIANKKTPETGREKIQYITVKSLDDLNEGPYYLGQIDHTLKKEEVEKLEIKNKFFRFSKIKSIGEKNIKTIEPDKTLWLENDGIVYIGDRANTNRNLIPLLNLKQIQAEV